MIVRIVDSSSDDVSAAEGYLERNIKNEGVYKLRIRKQDKYCKRNKIEGFY